MREIKKGYGFKGQGSREDLGGDGGGKPIIRIHCIKNIYFQ